MGIDKALAFFRNTDNARAIRLVARMLKEEQWSAFFLFSFTFVSSLLDVGVLSVFSFAIAMLAGGTETLLNIFPDAIKTGLDPIILFISKDARPSTMFVVLLGLGVLLQITKSSLDYSTAWLRNSLSARTDLKLIREITSLAINAEYSDIQDISTGELTALLEQKRSVGRLIRLSINVGVIFLALGVYIGVSVLVSWQMSLGVVLYALTLWLGMTVLARTVSRLSVRASKLLTKSSAIATEYFSIPRVIRLASAQEVVSEEVQQVHEKMIKANRSISVVRAIMAPAIEMFSVVVIVTILLVNVILLGHDASGTVKVFAVILIALRAKPHLMALNVLAVSFVKELPNAAVVARTLGQIRKGQQAPATSKKVNFEQQIELTEVALTYRSGCRALNNINLSIRRGQRIAILGRSGAGKSSLIDVITGLRVPTSGKVLIDGKNLSDINANDWRRLIGVVDQETILIRGSIRNNITFGMTDIEEAAVVEAARASRVHDFVVTLPQGYNTGVGERGVSLSGGQRQRIALARALIKKPSILLLDEAMSALDVTTEGEIGDSLKALPKDITIIIITHRLSLLDSVDDAIVLDQGEIVMRGSSQEVATYYQYQAR
jgi:ATP-binding cassette, subfamily B, bacterial MsbA